MQKSHPAFGKKLPALCTPAQSPRILDCILPSCKTSPKFLTDTDPLFNSDLNPDKQTLSQGQR